MTNELNQIDERIKWCVDFSWEICLKKIEMGEIKVDQEASLQLQYAYVLKQVLELAKFSPDERFDVELEKSFMIATTEKDSRKIIADVVINYNQKPKHIIELKYHKTFATSGDKRGAENIFMENVYKDLYYTELYVEKGQAEFTTCLVLTDFENLVNPKVKKTDAQKWKFDTSEGVTTKAQIYSINRGNTPFDFELKKQYKFKWKKNGTHWSCILRPF